MRFNFVAIVLIVAFGLVNSRAQNAPQLLPACEKKEKCGYIDLKGKMVIPATFITTSDFTEGLAAVEMTTVNGPRWGYVDASGRVVIEARYDMAWEFHDGRARVKKGDRAWFVDTKGNVIPGSNGFSAAGDFAEGLAVVVHLTDNRYNFVDREGRKAFPNDFEEAASFSEGLAAASSRGWWGYIDRKGEWAIKPQYFRVEPFREGVAAVKVGPDWTAADYGFIGKTGDMAISAHFTSAEDFSEGMAPVCDMFSKCGYIDRGGNTVIAFEFTAVGKFSDGLAVVSSEHGELRKYYYIKPDGSRNSHESYTNAFEFKNGVARVETPNFWAKLEIPPLSWAILTTRYIDKKEHCFWSWRSV